MRDNHHYRFEYFDPKVGDLPDPYAVMFVEINHRARKLLKDFSTEDITKSTLAINALVRDKDFINYLWEDLKNEPIPTLVFGQMLEIIPSTNDLEAINKNIGNVTLKDYINLPDYDWPQVFASLALYYSEMIAVEIDRITNWKPHEWFPKPTEERLLQVATEFLVEAQQAITIAEMLLQQKTTQKKFQSEQNRKAIKSRFAQTSDLLKDAVRALYLEKYTKRSNRSAAALIFQDLKNSGRLTTDSKFNEIQFDKKSVLNTDDPQHRFEKWIAEFKKELN